VFTLVPTTFSIMVRLGTQYVRLVRTELTRRIRSYLLTSRHMKLFVVGDQRRQLAIEAGGKGEMARRDGWKTKAVSPSKYPTEANAALSAIIMLLMSLLFILPEAHHRHAGLVAKSRLALTRILEAAFGCCRSS
jgi:hypothetical protein